MIGYYKPSAYLRVAFFLILVLQGCASEPAFLVNSTVSYAKPPILSARELFEEECQKRGLPNHPQNDESLHVLKIGEASSYKNKYSCTDFNLSEEQALSYFTKATEASPSNGAPCSISGVLRSQGVYKRWLINEDGSSMLFYIDPAANGERKIVYMNCKECADIFN